MGGDTSRETFDPRYDFSAVLLQQGCALLDADWNEMVRLFERRIRTACVDTIGRAVVPRETPGGFEIRFAQDGSLEYGRGRFYCDGYLCESPGRAEFDGTPQPAAEPPVFDRARLGDNGPEGVLDELISPEGGDFVPLTAQPYWPTPDGLPEAGAGGNAPGPQMVYLVCWQREVTPVMAPSLLDPALGGIATATRLQTVWQIRLLDVPRGTTCQTPDGQIEAWANLTQPSNLRLTTGTVDIEDPEDPCIVPPSDGYVGRENQHYRVQLHDVTADGVHRFKFSRENASVMAAVEAIGSPANIITVDSIGRDDKLLFHEGDWVELTDDHREFNHRSGRMLRISRVIERTRQIEFDREIDSADVGETGETGEDLIPTGFAGDTLAERHTRLIRWDQSGVIDLANGEELIDLQGTETEGLIPLPGDGSAVHLEAGITVTFTTDGPGAPHAMDWWSFHARTAGNQVDRLVAAPPQGIQRHHARLAVVDPSTSFVDDCRVFWPPEFEGGNGEEVESCGCTICVTPEGHNSGALTIQAAINQVEQPGGTVCLQPGTYQLTSPLEIANRNSIRLSGQGIGTVLTYRGQGGAIRISDGIDIVLDRISIFVIPQEDILGNLPLSHGVTAVNTAALMLTRLNVAVFASNPDNRRDHAIALDGAQIGTVVENCVALAAIALGSRSSLENASNEPDDPTFVAFAEMRVRDCTLFGGRDGVHFDRVAINLAAADFTGNLILARGVGMQVNWADTPIASASIERTIVLGSTAGMLLGAGDVRVKDCEISSGPESGVGIRTVSNLLPDTATDLRVIGNSIADLGGAGLRLTGRHGAVMVKQNIIRRCGTAGITVAADAQIDQLAVDNNHIEDIGAARSANGAAGIVVAGTAKAYIAGNAITAVGRLGGSGALYAGISGEAIAELTASDNTISDIGPNNPEAIAIGIVLRRPYGELALRGNRIEARAGDQAIAAWAAVEIGSPFEDVRDPGGPELPTGGSGNFTTLPAEPSGAIAYVALSSEVLRLSPTGLTALFPRRQSMIALTGSQITAELGLLRPAVTIHDGGALSLDMSHNQVVLAGFEIDPAPPLVLLGARRISVSSNTTVHRRAATSIALLTGPNGAATPLGNITASPIRLNGGNLPEAFAALNLIP